MKKIFKIFAICLFSVVLTVPALPYSAFATTRTLIVDELGVLSDSELKSLNDYALQISSDYQTDVVVLLAPEYYSENQTITEYAEDCYIYTDDFGLDGFIMAYDSVDYYWDIVCFGNSQSIISEADIYDLFAPFDEAESYSSGIREYLNAVDLFLFSAINDESPVFEGKQRFIDEENLLTAEQAAVLNLKLNEISERHQFDVTVAAIYSLGDKKSDSYAADFFKKNGFGYSGGSDGSMLLVSTGDRNFSFAALGFGIKAFTPIGRDYLMELFLPHLSANNYFEAFMTYADAADDFLTKAEAGEPYNKKTLPGYDEEEQLSRIVDEENLITAEQAAVLDAKLAEISERHQFDVVVATVYSLNGKEARLRAADFFEESGFGYGIDIDGSILLIATEDRDFGFASFGYGLYAFTSGGQKYLDTFFLPHLKEDDYFGAFMAYADAVDDFLNQAETGEPYTHAPVPELSTTAKIVLSVIGSLILALFLAFFITMIWKNQLKSVRRNNLAHAYIRDGSMLLTGHGDKFLYSHVDKTKRVTESSGGGGSFSSSSGRSSTGHSGKY